MKILSGQPIAQKILDDVRRRVKQTHARGITPTLAVILVGDNPASVKYVQYKKQTARKVGIDLLLYRLPADIAQHDIEQLLATLHLDGSVHGIVIQLPLPEHLNLQKFISFLDPDKDVDSFGDRSRYNPPTASAVLELLKYYKINCHNRKIGIVGKGFLVGTPLVKLLKKCGADVSAYDNTTQQLERECRKQNILISAAGQPHLVDDRFINKNQVVIDVGNARDPKTNKVVGDVDYKKIRNKVAAITPKVGGIGPITIALLLQNVIISAQELQT